MRAWSEQYTADGADGAAIASGELEPRNPSDGPVVAVPLSSLRMLQSPRVSGENAEHIQALAEAQERLPPIIVHRSTMCVIDGMHRVRAAELCGRDEIEVRFFDGDEADAFVLAVTANIAHGLPLSLADRKVAAARIIAAHPRWSDRLIATNTGLAAKTVRSLRAAVGDGAPEPGERVGQDGRVRPSSTKKGREIASEMVRRDPHLSLRQVARAAGISPETVRDVRRRLRSGEDPVLPRQRGAAPPATAPPATADGPPPPPHVRNVRLLSLIRQLKGDPALRVSDAAPALLKIVYANAVINEKLGAVVAGLPEHTRGTIARTARECARVWASFASELEAGRLPL